MLTQQLRNIGDLSSCNVILGNTAVSKVLTRNLVKYIHLRKDVDPICNPYEELNDPGSDSWLAGTSATKVLHRK